MTRIVFRQKKSAAFVMNRRAMKPVNWSLTVTEGVLSSGAVAVTAAWRALAEGQAAWEPINAVSHIAWGPRAANQRRWSLQFSLTGLILNTAACVFWAWLYQVWRSSRRSNSTIGAGAQAAAIAGLAYFTDYYVVPRRLTPGSN